MNVYTIASGIDIVYKSTPSIVWLRGKEYSSAAITLIRSHIAHHKPIYTLSPEEISFEHIQLQCASAFLGQTYYYFLGDITKYVKQKNGLWQSYITSYKGPHTLIFWAETSITITLSDTVIIDIPESIDAKSATAIIELFFAKQKRHLIPLLSQVWCHISTLTLDQLYAIAMYAPLINEPYDLFIREYVFPLLSSHTSLFTLSQYFFSKQKDLFYKQWYQCCHQYPLQFWISFWSDQLWRATLFIRHMRNNKRAEAQEIAKYRLPFSFIKTDWFFINPEIIQMHHTYICDLDFNTKNGGNDIWIELFFIRWFNA